MLLLDSSVCGLFKWRQFEPEIILLAVGWYLRFSLSYHDVEQLLAVVVALSEIQVPYTIE
jgi:transposase-like protein